MKKFFFHIDDVKEKKLFFLSSNPFGGLEKRRADPSESELWLGGTAIHSMIQY